MILGCLNLHRDYSNLNTLSNKGELSWSWIPKNYSQVQKTKENFVMACLHPPLNVKLGINFHVIIVQRGQRNVQKSVMHVQSCCLLIKPIAFLTFLPPSWLLDLKVPNLHTHSPLQGYSSEMCQWIRTLWSLTYLVFWCLSSWGNGPVFLPYMSCLLLAAQPMWWLLVHWQSEDSIQDSTCL